MSISLLILALSIDAVTCNANELLKEDIKKILNNEIIVKPIDNNDGVPGIMAAFAVSASREKIWTVLLDYENFQKIFEGIDKMKVIREDNNGALVEFWADAVLTKLHYTLYRHYEKPGYRLTWKRVSGDLEIIEGSWSIIDSPESGIKILIYRSFVKVGRIIPTRLVRWGATRKVDSMSKRVQEWILKLKD